MSYSLIYSINSEVFSSEFLEYLVCFTAYFVLEALLIKNQHIVVYPNYYMLYIRKISCHFFCEKFKNKCKKISLQKQLFDFKHEVCDMPITSMAACIVDNVVIFFMSLNIFDYNACFINDLKIMIFQIVEK